jgi:hypothetical protein
MDIENWAVAGQQSEAIPSLLVSTQGHHHSPSTSHECASSRIIVPSRTTYVLHRSIVANNSRRRAFTQNPIDPGNAPRPGPAWAGCRTERSVIGRQSDALARIGRTAVLFSAATPETMERTRDARRAQVAPGHAPLYGRGLAAENRRMATRHRPGRAVWVGAAANELGGSAGRSQPTRPGSLAVSPLAWLSRGRRFPHPFLMSSSDTTARLHWDVWLLVIILSEHWLQGELLSLAYLYYTIACLSLPSTDGEHTRR